MHRNATICFEIGHNPRGDDGSKEQTDGTEEEQGNCDARLSYVHFEGIRGCESFVRSLASGSP